MKIAFAGNPNSGKTTMFNALTGRNERVGNWAGVTVDKKEAPIRPAYAGDMAITAVDLPGAYSMSPFTAEESVTRDYIRHEAPDVLINIVDATNLSRSLFFTTQLLELGIPMVVALNKTDINEKKQTDIDTAALAEKLGCPVFETVSTNAQGLGELIRAAVARKGAPQTAPFVQGHVDMSDPEAVRASDRERFRFVGGIVREVEQRKVLTRDRNFQDKLDAVLTHTVVGIPIFAAVMFLVFHLSQAEGPLGLGVWLADLLAGWLEASQSWVSVLVTEAGAAPILHELLVSGII
ncbi:MAG: ferrous iron transporter B, partial [Clostridia bacterium]|nr:ferrous iron transporter B [Clostridia bacterium]